MVQVLEPRESFGETIGKGLGGGFSQGFAQATQEKLLNRQKAHDYIHQLGLQEHKGKLDFAQKLALKKAKEDENSLARLEQSKETEKSYNIIKDKYGQEVADIFSALPVGAQTELFKNIFESGKRELDVKKLLGLEASSKDFENNQLEKAEEISKSKDMLPEYKLDVSGMTPKERIDLRTNLRKENLPIWKESVDKIKGYKELARDVKILRNLDRKGNLPEGLEKLIINPETGAPYDLATAVKDMHPDVQQWVKTIARQATQAQSAFPGRVTNFDLQSYMRQFPSLFNTHEGREVILEQMELVNEANKTFEDALIKVYNKHKLGGITPEDALDLAQSKVQDELDSINEKIENLSSKGETIAEKGLKESEDTMDVYDATGNLVGTIHMSEVADLPEGFTVK